MRQRTPFRRIGVQEAEGLVRREEALVLDVRDAGSFGRAHIDGAQHVSQANVSGVLNGSSKSRPVVIYCYHGNSSRQYAQIFSDFGFAEVYSLDGGFEAWINRPQASADAPPEPALAEWLVAQGFPQGDSHAVIANSVTPLMKAAHLGDVAILRMLIAAGAPLDVKNGDGANALWLACVGRHLDAIDMLIDAGIDIDNRNDNGATALMYAASAGIAAVVERLLAKGADIAPQTLDGFTALDLAGSIECLTLLRRADRAASKAEG